MLPIFDRSPGLAARTPLHPRGDVQRYPKGDGGSLPGDADEADLARHQLHQALAQREPKTQPRIGTCGGSVTRLEPLKHPCRQRLVHTNPLIDDLEVHLDLQPLPLAGPQPELDPALPGELDGGSNGWGSRPSSLASRPAKSSR